MIRHLVPGPGGLAAFALLALGACAFTAPARANPLLEPSGLPLGAPAFDRIADADFAPAFAAAMEAHLQEVATIANNPAPPTFDNTLVALEKAGWQLRNVNLVFNALVGANTNDALQAVQQDIAPKLAAHRDAIFLDGKLFTRVAAVYDNRAALKLDAEDARLLDYYHQRFVRAGARLGDADKAKLKAMNEEEAGLCAKYAITLLDATKNGAVVIDDVSELAGLSQGEIDAAAVAAEGRGLKGQWLLPLRNTTQQPQLAALTNRATREKLFKASWNRAARGDANDTRALIAQLAALRATKAGLIGYPSFAAWTLEDQMARTPEAVEAFLVKLAPRAMANAAREAGEIQALVDGQHGGFELQPWDWDFYAEQVRKAKYDLDDAALKPYFELDRVLVDGVFYAASRLYGLTFRERHDLPTWQPDVRVFDVLDQDGTQIALFYGDFYARDNKNGGAWMDNLVVQTKLYGTKPVIFNCCNFVKPAAGQPALISLDDVSTMFHEFGHGLHGIFADQKYPTLSGSYTARDFVEMPSQINEHWAFEPTVFAHYAVHYKTGAPMPQELVDRVRKSATFNQGYALTELLAAAQLDMAWHALPAGSAAPDADAFEMRALEKAGLAMPKVPPRYRSSYFRHIWGDEYAAGYYAYLWAEMLDNDAFAWFGENGGLTRANGDRFRAMVLSRGNTMDYAEMYRAFRGRDPEIGPMLQHRGIGTN